MSLLDRSFHDLTCERLREIEEHTKLRVDLFQRFKNWLDDPQGRADGERIKVGPGLKISKYLRDAEVFWLEIAEDQIIISGTNKLEKFSFDHVNSASKLMVDLMADHVHYRRADAA